MRLYIHVVYLWIYTNTLNPKARTGFLTLPNSPCVKLCVSLAEGGWKIVSLWVKRFEADVN